eukprot:522616_1
MLRFSGRIGIQNNSRLLFTTQNHWFSISPFPIRVGYGLGSIIQPKILDSMAEEAAIRGKIAKLTQMDTELESTVLELTLQKNRIMNDRENSPEDNANREEIPTLLAKIDRLANMRKNILAAKINEYETLIVLQEKSYSAEHPNATFHSDTQSPVNWSLSKIDYFDRAHDSIEVSARFFDANIGKQKALSHIYNVADAVTTATKKFGNNINETMVEATHNSITHTVEDHNVESTLLLTATAYHRFVKQIVPLVIDPDQLYD